MILSNRVALSEIWKSREENAGLVSTFVDLKLPNNLLETTLLHANIFKVDLKCRILEQETTLLD